MNYSDLVVECAMRCGVPEFPARAGHYVQQAERDLEKVLSVGQMEAVADLSTDGDGIAPLPADFSRLRAVHGNGSLAISGADAWTGVPSGTVRIYYYARLPGLEANGTNWLLDTDPEIYIQAVLAQVYASRLDERAAPTVQTLQSRIDALRRADKISRFGGQIIDISGVS